MVNFGPRATVPEKFESRQLFEHNPVVTLMRTSPEECKSIGEFIAEKVKRHAQVPSRVQIVLPKGGVSIIATPGAPFHDAKADDALFEAIKSGLNSFMEDIPWLMKSLDEVAKIHPVVTGMLQYSTIESRYSYFRR